MRILKINRATAFFNLRISILVSEGALLYLRDDIDKPEVARFLIDGVDLLRCGCFWFCPIHPTLF